jgi:hypothetical protein
MNQAAAMQTLRLVLCSTLVLIMSAWTSGQQIFLALGGYMFAGPEAFPFKLFSSIAGTVYVAIGFWDFLYLVALLAMRRWFCSLDNRTSPLVAAVVPAVLVYLSGILLESWQQPAWFWVTAFIVHLLISFLTLGKGLVYGGQYKCRSTKSE